MKKSKQTREKSIKITFRVSHKSHRKLSDIAAQMNIDLSAYICLCCGVPQMTMGRPKKEVSK